MAGHWEYALRNAAARHEPDLYVMDDTERSPIVRYWVEPIEEES